MCKSNARSLPTEYRELDNSKVPFGYITNISEGGLMVSVTEKMRVGEKLRLKIFFISGDDLVSLDAIEVGGSVVWANNFGQ